MSLYLERAGKSSFNCPLQPGPYYIMNSSVLRDPTVSDDNKRSGIGFDIPNGIYRYTIKFSTKKVPSSFFIQWRTEIRNRLGEEDF